VKTRAAGLADRTTLLSRGKRDSVVRWRCVDLQLRIAQELGVPLHERTVGKLLRTLSFRRLSVRPQHPLSKPEEQAVFSAALAIS
jgi:Winged helix-turn helix